MKRIIILVGFLTTAVIANAQINAVTSEGDEVILNKNGTWVYKNNKKTDSAEIKTNPKNFVKDKNATFQIKSKKVKMGVWINPKNWSFEKSKEDEASEYMFSKKGEDLFAMLITERMQIPVLSLKDIAIENAQKVAPDVAVVEEEYRNVNGIKVLVLKLTGTIQGVKFSYFGYYYSNDSGTVQFVAYTGESLFNAYKKDIEEILNGLVLTE